jgi:hypothetical protein
LSSDSSYYPRCLPVHVEPLFSLRDGHIRKADYDLGQDVTDMEARSRFLGLFPSASVAITLAAAAAEGVIPVPHVPCKVLCASRNFGCLSLCVRGMATSWVFSWLEAGVFYNPSAVTHEHDGPSRGPRP